MTNFYVHFLVDMIQAQKPLTTMHGGTVHRAVHCLSMHSTKVLELEAVDAKIRANFRCRPARTRKGRICFFEQLLSAPASHSSLLARRDRTMHFMAPTPAAPLRSWSASFQARTRNQARCAIGKSSTATYATRQRLRRRCRHLSRSTA